MKVAGKIGVILGMAMLMEGISMSYGKKGTERSSTPPNQKNGRKLIFEIRCMVHYGNKQIIHRNGTEACIITGANAIDVITGASNTSCGKNTSL